MFKRYQVQFPNGLTHTTTARNEREAIRKATTNLRGQRLTNQLLNSDDPAEQTITVTELPEIPPPADTHKKCMSCGNPTDKGDTCLRCFEQQEKVRHQQIAEAPLREPTTHVPLRDGQFHALKGAYRVLNRQQHCVCDSVDLIGITRIRHRIYAESVHGDLFCLYIGSTMERPFRLSEILTVI